MNKMLILLAIHGIAALTIFLARAAYSQNQRGETEERQALDESLETGDYEIWNNQLEQNIRDNLVSVGLVGFLVIATLVVARQLVKESVEDGDAETLVLFWALGFIVIGGGAYFAIHEGDLAEAARLDGVVAYVADDLSGLNDAIDAYDAHRANRIAGGAAASLAGLLLTMTAIWYSRQVVIQDVPTKRDTQPIKIITPTTEAVRRLAPTMPPRPIEPLHQANSGVSLLYQSDSRQPAQKPTIEQILSEAQRMYKAGNIQMAISVLETTDDPRAQRVLAKLRGIKKK